MNAPLTTITTAMPSASLTLSTIDPAGMRLREADQEDRRDEMLSLVDVTERLGGSYSDRIDLSTIARIVSQCHEELENTRDVVPWIALESLARQRLNKRIGRGRFEVLATPRRIAAWLRSSRSQS